MHPSSVQSHSSLMFSRHRFCAICSLFTVFLDDMGLNVLSRRADIIIRDKPFSCFSQNVLNEIMVKIVPQREKKYVQHLVIPRRCV